MLSLLLFFCIEVSFAQNTKKEPNNNLGKLLSELRIVFPNVKYIRTDSKGDFYTDGEDPTEGIGCFFYFKNNKVIEECMIIKSSDGFPRMWFDKMVDTFITNYSPGFGTSSYNAKHWCYSSFQVHLMYFTENGENTAMIVYENGGYDTGVTGKEHNIFLIKTSLLPILF